MTSRRIRIRLVLPPPIPLPVELVALWPGLSHWPSVVDSGSEAATAHAGTGNKCVSFPLGSGDIQRLCWRSQWRLFLVAAHPTAGRDGASSNGSRSRQSKLRPLHYKIIKNWTHSAAEETNKQLANDTRHGMKWNAMRSARKRPSRNKCTEKKMGWSSL